MKKGKVKILLCSASSVFFFKGTSPRRSVSSVSTFCLSVALVWCHLLRPRKASLEKSNSSVGSRTCLAGFISSWNPVEMAPVNPVFRRKRDFWLRKIDRSAEQPRFCSTTAHVLQKSKFFAPQTPDFHRKTRFGLQNQELSTDSASFCSENSAFRRNTELSVSKSRRFWRIYNTSLESIHFFYKHLPRIPQSNRERARICLAS